MRWIDHWRYVSQSRRNLPLDLLRGYCVVVMTIDHAGMFPTWVQVFTGAAQLWVTAAEGFFIVAGLAFGIVYQRYLTERGANWTIGHLARRAGRLYLLSVIGHWLLATGDFVLRLIVNRSTDLPQDYGQVIEGALLQLRVAPGSFGMLAVYALLLPLGLGRAVSFTSGALALGTHWLDRPVVCGPTRPGSVHAYSDVFQCGNVASPLHLRRDCGGLSGAAESLVGAAAGSTPAIFRVDRVGDWPVGHQSIRFNLADSGRTPPGCDQTAPRLTGRCSARRASSLRCGCLAACLN